MGFSQLFDASAIGPFSLFIVTLLIVSAGLLALPCTLFRWQWMTRFVGTVGLKLVLCLLKAFSAFAGVMAREVDSTQKLRAVVTVCLAIVGYLLWEAVDAIGSHKKERDQRRDADHLREKQQHIDRIRYQGYIRAKLIGSLGQLVCDKKQRVLEIIQTVAKGGYQRNRPEAHRAGLGPETHMLHTIQHLAVFLRELLPRQEESEAQNFRIAFYVELDGEMRPIESWDHLKKARQFLQSYKLASRQFRIDCIDHPACAVRCIQERKLLIVADCDAELTLFHSAQGSYLKSLIAFPMIDYINPQGRKVAASLVVDTNIPGYFTEEDRPTIQTYIEQFALRLDLESAISGLLGKAGDQSHG